MTGRCPLQEKDETRGHADNDPLPEATICFPCPSLSYRMLVQRIDLVYHRAYVLGEVGGKVSKVGSGLQARLLVGHAADIAAVHREDGREQVFYVFGIGCPVIQRRSHTLCEQVATNVVDSALEVSSICHNFNF